MLLKGIYTKSLKRERGDVKHTQEKNNKNKAAIEVN